MNVVFVSNFFNHHQRSLSDAMNRLCEKYYFISTQEMPEERRQLGYGESNIPDYVLSCNDTAKTEIAEIIAFDDVVIIGSAPKELLRACIQKQKLVFRYSERPFKKEQSALKSVLRRILWTIDPPEKKNMYLICSSAFTAHDYADFGLFKGKAYKWGYFPETKHYDLDELFGRKNRNEILWCGRFLDWKHPDDAVRVAQRLKADGYDFTMNIIGRGDMEDELRKMICDHQLEDCVHLLGSMPQEKVREYMEQAGIYLFTSDRQEGWGAVLNESMNSGCAVVASHAIGAVPYLVKNGENGLIFRSGDIDELYLNVKLLLEHPEEQHRLGEAAYQTITEEWNAEIAAKRFVDLAQHILSGEKYPDLYKSGPCSKAEIIKDDWYIG